MSAARIMIATAEPGFDVVLAINGSAVTLKPEQAISLARDLLRFGQLSTKRFILNDQKWIDP